MLGETTRRGATRGFVWHELESSDPPLLVCSTGIGAPAAAVVVEELSDVGIRAMVRIGTCGKIADHVGFADLVVSTGCVRHEGTSKQYIDVEFPAVPSHLVLSAMVDAADHCGVPVHFGITDCKDSYYSEKPARNVDENALRTRWNVLDRAGVLVTEMEAAALFVVGALRGIHTGGVFIPITHDTSSAAVHEALTCAIELGRSALGPRDRPLRSS